MSTIDELADGVMDNLNPENFMDEAVKVKITLHMKPVIEALLAQGWRPPMREVATVEELEALQNNEERAIPQEAVEAAEKKISERINK